MNNENASSSLSLFVRQITYQAHGIVSYELVDPEGKELPPFTAGSHIDVKISEGFIRQYSLCNDPSERDRYVIAVLMDKSGRGGSRAIHESVKIQDIIKISFPRNNFPLSSEAKRHILIAGGIGVTPLKSMAHHLDKIGENFELHYCTKNIENAAFQSELKPFIEDGRAFMHYDNGNPVDGLDLIALLSEQKSGSHVYYCGPSGFMSACSDSSKHWEDGTVHFEHFKAPEFKKNTDYLDGQDTSTLQENNFEIKINSTGEIIEVPSNKSVAEVLGDNGYHVETSCESGLCATCKVRYLEGEVDHQDYILGDDERTQYFTSCVSRSKSKILVLDI